MTGKTVPADGEETRSNIEREEIRPDKERDKTRSANIERSTDVKELVDADRLVVIYYKYQY